MRNPILILVFAIFLTSCISGGRIIENNDSNKEIESLKLVQKIWGNPVDKTIDVSDRLNHPISTTYLLEIKKGEKVSLLLDIQMQTSGKTDKPDSLMLMYLDGEKIEITASKDGATQIKLRQFVVPENLWISIANTEKIQYKFNLGKEEFEVKLNKKETGKLKEFLLKAIQLRDANLPPMPEGLKKL